MEKILFLHGALASASQFDNLRAAVKDNYETHALNFSGHGGNMIPAQGLSFTTFTHDILTYLDENKIDTCNLWGYSMGGYAALFFASRHPNRVSKIFTTNVKFRWDIESTIKETAMLDAEKMLEKIPGFANNLMLQHGMNLWKNLLKSTSDMMMDLAKGTILTDEDYTKISHTCRLSVGDRDQTSSIEETKEAFQKLAHASMVVLPDTPHPFEKIDTHRLVFETKSFFSI